MGCVVFFLFVFGSDVYFVGLRAGPLEIADGLDQPHAPRAVEVIVLDAPAPEPPGAGMHRPPISGSFLEPKISTTITRIKSNSCMPMPYIKASVFIGQRYTDGSRAGQAKGVASFCPSGYTTKCRGGMEALTRPEGPKSAQVRITGINGKHSTPVRFRGQDCKAAARELLQRMYHAKRIG